MLFGRPRPNFVYLPLGLLGLLLLFNNNENAYFLYKKTFLQKIFWVKMT